MTRMVVTHIDEARGIVTIDEAPPTGRWFEYLEIPGHATRYERECKVWLDETGMRRHELRRDGTGGGYHYEVATVADVENAHAGCSPSSSLTSTEVPGDPIGQDTIATVGRLGVNTGRAQDSTADREIKGLAPRCCGTGEAQEGTE